MPLFQLITIIYHRYGGILPNAFSSPETITWVPSFHLANAMDLINGFFKHKITLEFLHLTQLCHNKFFILLDSVSNFLLGILHLRLSVQLVHHFIFTVLADFHIKIILALTGLRNIPFFFPLIHFVYYWNYLFLESLIRT